MLKISSSHPTFQLKNKIQSICDNFLAQHGFNYFQYLRCFKDGSCSLLTNNTGGFEYFSQISDKPVVYSSYTQEHENLHSYWFLWDEELPTEPVNLVREKFNLQHGLTLVRRSKNYYDMIAVALPHERRNIASFYLTKHKAIEQFINTFDKNHGDLIHVMNKNPLLLPKPYRDENYEKICLKNGKLKVVGRFGPCYITTQELSCLRLWLQGSTLKQIAYILHLSPRTVETYLTRVKQKSGAINRTQLDELIAICP